MKGYAQARNAAGRELADQVEREEKAKADSVRESPDVEPKDGEVPNPAVAYSPHGSMGGDIFGDDAQFESVPPKGDRAEPSREAVDMEERPDDEERVRRTEEQVRLREEHAREASHAVRRSRKSEEKRTVKAVVKGGNIPVCKLADVPKCLVDQARRAFPAASRQQDAVAAYIYFHEGMPADMEVPDDVVRIAMSYTGEDVTVDTVKDIVERDMLDIKAQNRTLLKKLDTLQLAMAYMIFERAGFAKETPMSPDSVKFLEKGINDLIARLESDAETQRMRKARQEGRPIR